VLVGSQSEGLEERENTCSNAEYNLLACIYGSTENGNWHCIYCSLPLSALQQ